MLCVWRSYVYAHTCAVLYFSCCELRPCVPTAGGEVRGLFVSWLFVTFGLRWHFWLIGRLILYFISGSPRSKDQRNDRLGLT